MRCNLNFLLAIAIFLSHVETSFAATLETLRQAEKISLSLTGQPLPDDLRVKFLKDEITLEMVADNISQQAGFIQYFAEFWTQLLGLQNGIAPWDLMLKKQETTIREILPISAMEVGLHRDGYYKMSSEDLDRVRANKNSRVPELRMAPCKKNGELIGSVFYQKSDFVSSIYAKEAIDKGTITEGGITNAVREGSKDGWRRMYDFLVTFEGNCENNGFVEVQPWWDPKGNNSHTNYSKLKYYAASGIYRNCGNNKEMSLCSMIWTEFDDPFITIVGSDMSMEASYLISHTVAENRPFSEILTTQDSIMTGSYGAFIARRGKELLSNFPNETIKDIGHKIFTKPDVTDRTHYRIARGERHAGVLTTPVYQLLTNGRRAKANKAYEMFLCEKFAVPEGIIPDPTDENEDLTKRQYCDTCHKTLEPMAAFFNSWPTTGAVDFIYSDGKDDRGRFNGVDGKGVFDFGKILSSTDQFVSCSVERAFEFVNGRKMSKDEREKALPNYVKKMKASNLNLRPVINEMVLAPSFLNKKIEGSK